MLHNFQHVEEYINRLERKVEDLRTQVESGAGGGTIIPPQAPQPPAPVQAADILFNGDLQHSRDTYLFNPSVADNRRYECYNFFTHPQPAAGQQLIESSTDAPSGANDTVMDAASTNYAGAAINDPDWLLSKGYFRLGTTNTIDVPLPNNIAGPGKVLYLSMIIARALSSVVIPGKLFAGIWDNTVGKRNWVTAAPFSCTATLVGVPGGSVSRDYKVILYTDRGVQIGSTVSTLANAPANGSFVSGSVYVVVSWPVQPGILYIEVHRKTGATYELIATLSGGTQYFDQGAIEKSEAGYPATTDTAAKAIVTSRPHELDSVAVDGVTPKWDQITFAIQIPPSYDQTGTTDKQWLRIGLDTALTGVGAAHGLFIDLINLSWAAGVFENNAKDFLAAQNVASRPNTSAQGGAGIGGGGGSTFVPANGSGYYNCVTSDAEVLTINNRFERDWIKAGDLRNYHRVVSTYGGLVYISTIMNVERAIVESVYTILTETGHRIKCSPSHPLITHRFDRSGLRAELLKKGDTILVYDAENARAIEARIRRTSVRRKKAVVVKLTLDAPYHTFIARAGSQLNGGIAGHNYKSYY